MLVVGRAAGLVGRHAIIVEEDALRPDAGVMTVGRELADGLAAQIFWAPDTALGVDGDCGVPRHHGLAPHRLRVRRTAFEYADFGQWIDNCVRLRDEGLVPFLNLDHGMTMSMYYQDPEGNGVEIQVDGFGDWAAGKEWMWSSEEFGANPIGVHFDPERLVEAHRSGVGWQEIHRRSRAGEYEPAVKPEVHLPELW